MDEDEEMHTAPPLEGPQPVQGPVAFDGTPPVEPTTVEAGGAAGGREKRDMADLDVGGGDVGSSNTGKRRRIVHVKRVSSVNEVNWGSFPWSRTLYGYFPEKQGQEQDFSLFCDTIRNVWKAHGIEIEYIVEKIKGFYVFKVKNDEGTSDALDKRAWTIGDAGQFAVSRWTPAQVARHVNRIPVWIKIHGMPDELWNMEVLNFIGSMLGGLMVVDSHTRRGCRIALGRADYAHILVDVGLALKLVDEISVSFPIDNGSYRVSNHRIEYTGKFCTYCKVLGHTDSNCSHQTITKANQGNEKERKDKTRNKAPAHLNTDIKVVVACDEDLFKQIGKAIYIDLVDLDKVRSFHVKRQMPFNSIKEEVARSFGVPVQCQRFWTWEKRVNRTYRPHQPLTRKEEAQSVGLLRAAYNKNNMAKGELNLFLETMDVRLLPPPNIREDDDDDILVFFKLYEPDKSQLRYVGSFFVRSFEKPTEIITKLNEKAGFSLDEEIQLYKETKSKGYDSWLMCERLDKGTSFGSRKIKNGDIICFQKLSQAEAWDTYKYPDVPSFLEYVNYRKVVHFRSKDKPKEDAFSLELSKLHTYDDVAGSVAKQLDVDVPSQIRFTAHNCHLKQPESHHPIAYQVKGHLLDMLGNCCDQGHDIMYYELLDIPLPELERLKTLKVTFYHATKEEPLIHNITLLKQSTVGDVLTEINRKVNVSQRPDAELRLLQLYRHRICKVFSPTEKIADIDDEDGTLRAEKIPEEEKVLGPGDRRIRVYHFTRQAEQNQMVVKNFGEPFFLVIRGDETLAAVKARIRLELQVPDDEFSKWKFALVCQLSPKYLRDSDIISSLFQRAISADSEPSYLGLEHLE